MCAALTDFLFEYIDGRTWRLYADFVWRFRDGVRLLVPDGFVSDFHSVPRAVRWLVPAHEYGEAAVAHDFLYKRNGFVTITVGGVSRVVQWSRKECDLRYLMILREKGAGWLRRQVMYRAVRLGGWVAWRKHYDGSTV